MVSLLLPVYNQSDIIAPFLKEVAKRFGEKKIGLEILLVDDNSPDGTGEIAYYLQKHFHNLRTFHRKKKESKLSAFISLLPYARGKIIGHISPNEPHSLDVLTDLVLPLISSDIDITVGSNFLETTERSELSPWFHLIRKSRNTLFRGLSDISDPFSKVFFLKKSVLSNISLDMTKEEILPEILLKGKYTTIQEIPYHYTDEHRQTPPSFDILHIIKLYSHRISTLFKH